MADEQVQKEENTGDRVMAVDISMGVLLACYTLWLITAISRHFTN